MKVKQAKLAQTIRGEVSNLLEAHKYELTFDKGMLTARLKVNPKKFGDFVIFPANIAWLEMEQEEASQTRDKAVTEKTAPKK